MKEETPVDEGSISDTCTAAQAELTALISEGPLDLVKDSGVVFKTGSDVEKFSTELGDITEDTVLKPVYSASKMITSILINMLAEKEVLDLDKPLHKYLDWWTSKRRDPRSKVTLRHLLSQTSGFGSDIMGMFGNPSCEFNPEYTQESCAKELYENYYGVLGETMFPGWGYPDFENEDVSPGSHYFYSESNFVIALAVVEAVTGEKWTTLFTEHIGEPLGLQDSCQYSGISVFDKNAVLPDTMVIDGGAGLSCSATDLASIVSAYFNGELVSAETMLDMETAWTSKLGAKLPVGNAELGTVTSTPVNYGLGMWVECADAACSDPSTNFVHSIGADGVAQFVDRRDADNEYYGLIFREEGDLQGMLATMVAMGEVARVSSTINAEC